MTRSRQGAPRAQVCNDYLNTGFCRFGQSCKFGTAPSVLCDHCVFVVAFEWALIFLSLLLVEHVESGTSSANHGNVSNENFDMLFSHMHNSSLMPHCRDDLE